MLLREFHDLVNLGLGDCVSVDPSQSDAVVVDRQHDVGCLDLIASVDTGLSANCDSNVARLGSEAPAVLV